MTDTVTPETLLAAHAAAVRAETKADQHIQDCTMFRLRLAEDFREVKSDIKDVRGDLKKQTIILALVLGALTGLQKLPELLKFVGVASN